jgi:hypothetical protein
METESVEGTREARVTRAWSPGQVIAGIIGLLLTVMGGVALARVLPTDSLTATTTTVLGVGHTPLMAIITLGLGLLYLTEAAAPFDVQPGLIFLGVASLAFGLIVVEHGPTVAVAFAGGVAILLKAPLLVVVVVAAATAALLRLVT